METRIKEIPYTIKVANTFFSRFQGLMFRKHSIKNEGLWIIPCNSIHMFFMSFPIDAVFLNDHNRIVNLSPKIKPWQMTKPNKSAYSTLELPEGTVDELGLEIGDFITINKT